MSKSRISELTFWTSVVACIGWSAAGAAPTDTDVVPITVGATTPLETIVVNAAKITSGAAAVAPTLTPLDAIQPTSVISQDFIEKVLPPSANYDEIIKFSPSVFNTAPNGPGLAESQNISIRGFQDGQFNVTFDGIPFQDANDFTHHSTSYFNSQVLGQVSVDRGPGTAATIGNATFGGTVSVLTKAPDPDSSVKAYFTGGSFNTRIYGGELQSGKVDQTNGTRVLFDFEDLNSDGYLTNESQERENATVKIIQPINDSTVLTLAAVYNHLNQGISLGATAAEIAQFGPNHGLSRDPANQNYFGYNRDFINSDFEYADLQSNLGAGWTVDIKAYSYAYLHKGLNGEDPNGAYPNTYPNTTTLVSGQVTNDVPGQLLTNNYRSIGTISRFTKNIDSDWFKGDVDFGFWYDHQNNARSLYEVDLTDGLARNVDPNTGANPDGIDRQLHQTLQTLQAYVQVDWKPIDNLTLTPGFRYAYFDRSVEADVNVRSGLAQQYDNTFATVLPSFTANYLFTPNWSSYLEVAAGALAPNENFFNKLTPTTTKLDPQTSWNYQIGTSYRDNRFAASIDGYYIDFSNLITATPGSGGNVIYINNGGVTYKGVEADATYNVGYGVALYVNGSVNSARSQTTRLDIPNAPDATAAFGILYNQRGFSASLIDKWVGSRFGDVGEIQHLDPFYTLDLAVGYDLPNIAQWVKDASIKVQVNNLANDTKIINLAGYTVGNPVTGAGSGTPLYWTNPGRSVFATITGKF